jgi:hypothetical protein
MGVVVQHAQSLSHEVLRVLAMRDPAAGRSFGRRPPANVPYFAGGGSTAGAWAPLPCC